MKYNKFDELKMVEFLRFRRNDPSQSRYTHMTIEKIAKFLNRSNEYVRKLCSKLIQAR